MNKEFKNHIIRFILFFIIFLYHYCILNGLEKNFNKTYFNYHNVRRPLEKCKNQDNKCLNCVGMPSGHAEISTIISLLLYSYNYINQYLCIFIIVVVSLQRIVSNMHTFPQIIAGIIIGSLYSLIYIHFNLSIFAFLIVISIGFILIFLIIYKIDKDIYGEVPGWVDKNMLSSIDKKINVSYYSKIIHIISNNIHPNSILFINWRNTEQYLDILIDKIKKSNIQFDGIVGIKTGGAILSNYISNKLNIKNYKVKLTKNKFNCNKNNIDSFYESIIERKWSKYTICEGVHDNLEGKNLIVIDELVDTGNTISECIKYLKTNKKANIIYPVCIILNNKKYNNKESIEYVNNNNKIIIWPWGYEN